MDADIGIPPNLSEWIAGNPKGLKNLLVIRCRICGMANRAPGLPRKENLGAEATANSEARPVKKAARLANRGGKPTEIEAGRDFVPLGPATILSNRKKRNRSNNKPASQLHDFLNTLND
jgi:hypothetical protein